MRQACYSADNIGHYGLSLEHYCHFTSPIRRYTDLMVHRLLFDHAMSRDDVVRACETASGKERVSARAESTVRNLKKLRLLLKDRERSVSKSYEAIITRVKPFGISFDITEFMLEGFLHISDLEDDYFEFCDKTGCLEGRYTQLGYRCGGTIQVRCRSVDLMLQSATWSLVGR